MWVNSEQFELLQFHFHKPSEELIDGKPAAMVAHFVHKSDSGKLAVIGVLLKETGENRFLKSIWQNAPKVEGPEVEVAGATINPTNLLPTTLKFWTYEGSLTTPPCTEGVSFFILKNPAHISRDQLEAFPFKMNARPVQPLNGRKILSD
jgi:carbonic anhydrase